MPTTTRRTSVAAAPDVVWKVLADFERIAQWAAPVDHAELLTEGELGVGTVRRIQTGRLVVTERVTECEPGSTLAYEIGGLPRFARRVTNRWTLTASGGGTDVALTTEVEPGPRPPHRIAAGVLLRRLAKTSDELLTGLAHHLR